MLGDTLETTDRRSQSVDSEIIWRNTPDSVVRKNYELFWTIEMDIVAICTKCGRHCIELLNAIIVAIVIVKTSTWQNNFYEMYEMVTKCITLSFYSFVISFFPPQSTLEKAIRIWF